MFIIKSYAKNKFLFVMTTLLFIGISTAMAMNKKEEKPIELQDTLINFETLIEDVLNNKAKISLKYDIIYDIIENYVTKCISTYKTFLTEEKIIDSKEFLNDSPLTYIQKTLTLPNDVFLHAIIGDGHASPSFLCIFLWLIQAKFIDSSLKIIKPNFYIHFLGDIADNGPFGIECWLFVLCLKLRNWNTVSILRGNHERKHSNIYIEDFTEELIKKFGQEKGQIIYKLFLKLWNLLPSALCVGNDMFLSHGGIPCTYENEKYSLSESFVNAVNEVKTTITISPEDSLSLSWNDFCGEEECKKSSRGGSTVNVGSKICTEFMKKTNKKLLCKGHQDKTPFMWQLDHYKKYASIPGNGSSEAGKQYRELTKNILENFEWQMPPGKISLFPFDLNALQNDKQFSGVFTFSVYASFLFFNEHFDDIFLPIVEQENNSSQMLTILCQDNSSYFNL